MPLRGRSITWKPSRGLRVTADGWWVQQPPSAHPRDLYVTGGTGGSHKRVIVVGPTNHVMINEISGPPLRLHPLSPIDIHISPTLVYSIEYMHTYPTLKVDVTCVSSTDAAYNSAIGPGLNTTGFRPPFPRAAANHSQFSLCLNPAPVLTRLSFLFVNLPMADRESVQYAVAYDDLFNEDNNDEYETWLAALLKPVNI